MRWQLRVGLFVALLSLALSACGSDAEAVDGPTWAAGVCGAGTKFSEAILNSRDNEDPSTLDLPERKERAARLGQIESDAAHQFAQDLEAIEPPDGARDYHEALVQLARDIEKAIDNQVDAIEKATTAQQIAVANASAQFELQGSNTEVTTKAATVPDDLVQALLAQDTCGRVPVPGQPTPPATATPSV
jgi:hypothetical protein